MTDRISDNSCFTISDKEALEVVRKLDASRVEHETMFARGEAHFDPTSPPPEEYLAALESESLPPDLDPDSRWEEDYLEGLRSEQAWTRWYQIVTSRALTRARAALRARGYRAQRTQVRVRARRSPASTRRATDSGGDDGGGDHEPPRPRSSNLSPIRGGAL